MAFVESLRWWFPNTSALRALTVPQISNSLCEALSALTLNWCTQASDTLFYCGTWIVPGCGGGWERVLKYK